MNPTIANLAIGVALGIPAGASVTAIKDVLWRRFWQDKLKLKSPERDVDMPILSPDMMLKQTPKVNAPELKDVLNVDRMIREKYEPVAKEKATPGAKVSGPEKARLERKEDEEPAKEKSAGILDAVNVAHVLGGMGGAAAGMTGFDWVTQKRREQELDRVIAERKAVLQKLLTNEQVLGAGLAPEKTAGVMDYTIAEGVKQIAEVYKRLSPASKAVLTIAPALGGAYAFGNVYSAAKAADPNRYLYDKMQEILLARLGGGTDEKGNKIQPSPQVLKVDPLGIGLSPLKPGASALTNPSAGRDVLGRL